MGGLGEMNRKQARGATCVFPTIAIVLTAFAGSAARDEY